MDKTKIQKEPKRQKQVVEGIVHYSLKIGSWILWSTCQSPKLLPTAKKGKNFACVREKQVNIQNPLINH